MSVTAHVACSQKPFKKSHSHFAFPRAVDKLGEKFKSGLLVLLPREEAKAGVKAELVGQVGKPVQDDVRGGRLQGVSRAGAEDLGEFFMLLLFLLLLILS